MMRRVAVLVAIAVGVGTAVSIGRAEPSAAIAGRVTSMQEGAMEGVLVSAKRAGSNMTVTVVSDAEGRYRFPAARLEPGRYSITIRAAGYDLIGRPSAEVAAGQAARGGGEPPLPREARPFPRTK